MFSLGIFSLFLLLWFIRQVWKSAQCRANYVPLLRQDLPKSSASVLPCEPEPAQVVHLGEGALCLAHGVLGIPL